jgi:trimeric autotransporter adhesin
MRKFYFSSLFALLMSMTVRSQIFSLVKDINPGTNNSYAGNLTAINNKLFFSADDGTHGSECWTTDGTEAGTMLFKDINPGVGGSTPSGFIKISGVIYFIADDGIHGRELWKTDGTASGTVIVKDINPGSAGSSLSSFINVNGKLFFIANDGSHGTEIWKTDGTEAGTVLIKDINTNPAGGYPGNNSYPWQLTVLNGALYFGAFDGPYQHGLWKTDGTAAGTVLLRYITINQIRNIGNTLFFSGTGDPANSLWKSDGTAAGTVLVKQTGVINSITDVNGTIYFYTIGGPGVTAKIWKSDGTTDGTVAIKSISVAGGLIGYFTSVGGKLFFAAPDPSGGTEVWKSDGTEAGTIMVKDIYAGNNSSEPFNLTKINDKLFFSASNGTFGKEIWRSDGTEDGTVMMQDIANPGDAMPSEFTLMGSKVFVSVTNNVYGRELWVADLAAPAGGLPLTILDFSGRLANTNALLTWQTVAEHNTSHFDVERSIDGRVFTKTAAMNAAGNSTVTKSYTYTDRNVTLLGTNTVYYRLKMHDLDHKFTYSKIIAVNINNPETVVMFYPNPVTENATLMVAALKKENVSYSIIDQHGRTMLVANTSINEGSNMITIETTTLSAGIYTIVLKGPITNTRVKFMKQ